MRATDERHSINVKCRSSLELPDTSQGKQFNFCHEASPLSPISLRHVWKRALDSGTVVSDEGLGGKSLASRKDGCVDKHLLFFAGTMSRGQRESSLQFPWGGGSTVLREQKTPFGLPLSSLADLQTVALDFVKQTSIADTLPVKIFCTLTFCASALEHTFQDRTDSIGGLGKFL